MRNTMLFSRYKQDKSGVGVGRLACATMAVMRPSKRHLLPVAADSVTAGILCSAGLLPHGRSNLAQNATAPYTPAPAHVPISTGSVTPGSTSSSCSVALTPSTHTTTMHAHTPPRVQLHSRRT